MAMKKCSRCHALKSVSEFYKDSQKRDGLTSRCKICVLSQCKAYNRSELGKIQYQKRLKSGDFIKNGARYYASDHGREVRRLGRNSERAVAYRRSDRRRSVENISRKQPHRIAAERRYLLSPAGRAKIAKDRLKRRSITRAVTATLTGAEWEAILVTYNHKCAYCQVGDVKLTMDHVIPISRGGEHVKENIAPACARCNSKKHNKLPSEFGWPQREVSL